MLHALAKLRILRKILPSLRERLSLAGPYSSAGHCPASPSLFRRAMLGATRLWPTFRPPRGERPPGRSVDPWITMRVDTSSVIRLAEDRRMTASPRGEALTGELLRVASRSPARRKKEDKKLRRIRTCGPFTPEFFLFFFFVRLETQPNHRAVGKQGALCSFSAALPPLPCTSRRTAFLFTGSAPRCRIRNPATADLRRSRLPGSRRRLRGASAPRWETTPARSPCSASEWTPGAALWW